MPSIYTTAPSISSEPIKGAFPVVASTTPFTNGPCRGLYLGTTGTITIIDLDNNEVAYANLTAGVVHPIAALGVTSVGVATNCLALY